MYNSQTPQTWQEKETEWNLQHANIKIFGRHPIEVNPDEPQAGLPNGWGFQGVSA